MQIRLPKLGGRLDGWDHDRALQEFPEMALPPAPTDPLGPAAARGGDTISVTNPSLVDGTDTLITARALGFGHVIAYSLDGTGNNPHRPAMATVGAEQLRLAPSNFADATQLPIDHAPTDGPNARLVSTVLLGSHAQQEDPAGHSAYVYAFGQFVDHDLDLTVSQTGPTAAKLAVTVPPGDPALQAGATITITRAQLAFDGNALNGVTALLDLSQIYGSDATTAASLRGNNGTLLTSEGSNPPIVNGRFVGGDVRASENPDLTAVDALFLREHNSWAAKLLAQAPSLTGDQIYAMARAITTAEYQNIVYNEYLPNILGPHALTAYRGYDARISTQIYEEFSAAAFRFGHSTISTREGKIANDGTVLEQTDLLAAMMSTTSAITASGGFAALLRNLAQDTSNKSGLDFPSELLNMPNPGGGAEAFDLGAADVLRERDLGLATLNTTREALGLTVYKSFAELSADPTVAAELQQVYGSIDKVDLFIGGLAEHHVRSGMLGETFTTIIARQFQNLRDGDRLYFENQGFAPGLMDQIEHTTLATLILRNTDTTALQHNVMMAAERHASDVPAADPTMAQLIVGVNDAGAMIRAVPGAQNTLVAGTGDGQLLVGGGSQTDFVFGTAPVHDQVSGFRPGIDHIVFHGQPPGVTAHEIQIDPLPPMVGSSGGSRVHLGEVSVTVLGINPKALTASDFIVDG